MICQRQYNTVIDVSINFAYAKYKEIELLYQCELQRLIPLR